MFNHFTRRNMPTVDSILQLIQVVVYGYSVVLPKFLIGKHIHERWQQKSQEPQSQFGIFVDHNECEKATLFNIGLASKTDIIFIDLEDKITFRGVGNGMINIVSISCLFTNMLCNEEIICDIKVVEVEMMERIRHKKMLLSSWSDALEFYHVQIMDTLEVFSMEPLEVDSLMVLESLFTNEVPLSTLVEIFLYVRYRHVTFKNLLPVGDYAAQSKASPIYSGCTLSLLGLEDMLQQLQKLAPEPYHVHLLSYYMHEAVMDDKSHTKSYYEDVLVYRSFCLDPGEPIPLAADRRAAWVCKIIRGIYLLHKGQTTTFISNSGIREFFSLLLFLGKSKKWDPGGCSLVHLVYKEGMLNLELTL
jgi:hypothetical protein